MGLSRVSLRPLLTLVPLYKNKINLRSNRAGRERPPNEIATLGRNSPDPSNRIGGVIQPH